MLRTIGQCQDNVTQRDIVPWCWGPVGPHYKVTMSAYCHMSVPLHIVLLMTERGLAIGHHTLSHDSERDESNTTASRCLTDDRMWFSYRSSYIKP